MDQIKDQIGRLNAAMFGGTDEPGVIHRVRHIEAATTEIKQTLSRLAWIVVTAVIAAVLALVMKGH